LCTASARENPDGGCGRQARSTNRQATRLGKPSLTDLSEPAANKTERREDTHRPWRHADVRASLACRPQGVGVVENPRRKAKKWPKGIISFAPAASQVGQRCRWDRATDPRFAKGPVPARQERRSSPRRVRIVKRNRNRGPQFQESRTSKSQGGPQSQNPSPGNHSDLEPEGERDEHFRWRDQGEARNLCGSRFESRPVILVAHKFVASERYIYRKLQRRPLGAPGWAVPTVVLYAAARKRALLL